ncbi:uncharacterized protein F4812DRAFT_425290 [Daldinia caldariorum]|uniref:uncharacterized protein n=1 Tax=Daldinia caldariorum TaxID=326644 RepID=UPI002007815D|nr:uncharacterized protein F4812DRAFT_425290 [Daldinia caldariorum]KAI1468952.1 hypothetical protein F4812DRAFT_425290 [Daldinia caldariorum]
MGTAERSFFSLCMYVCVLCVFFGYLPVQWKPDRFTVGVEVLPVAWYSRADRRGLFSFFLSSLSFVVVFFLLLVLY